MFTSLRLIVSFGSKWDSLVGLLGTLNANSSFLVDFLGFFEEPWACFSHTTGVTACLESWSATLAALGGFSVLDSFTALTLVFSLLFSILFSSELSQETALTVTMLPVISLFATTTFGLFSSTTQAWMTCGCSSVSCFPWFSFTLSSLPTGVATIVTLSSEVSSLLFSFTFLLSAHLSCASLPASFKLITFFRGFGIGRSPSALLTPFISSTLPFLSRLTGTGGKFPLPSSSVDELLWLVLAPFFSSAPLLMFAISLLLSFLIWLWSWQVVGGSGAFRLITELLFWSLPLFPLVFFGGDGAFLLATCNCSSELSSEMSSVTATLGGLGGGINFSFSIFTLFFVDTPFSNTLRASASLLGVCDAWGSRYFLSFIFSWKQKTVKHQISINKLQVNFAPHIVGAQCVQSHKM